MLNSIPILGWVLDFVFKTSLAFVFWLVWTSYGNGEYFFGDYLPAQFINIGFWRCVGLFISVGIINSMLPKIVSISNTSGK